MYTHISAHVRLILYYINCILCLHLSLSLYIYICILYIDIYTHTYKHIYIYIHIYALLPRKVDVRDRYVEIAATRKGQSFPSPDKPARLVYIHIYIYI